MKREVLIYSGTTEGKQLANILAKAGVGTRVCVATEYGKLVMEKSEYVDIVTGRRNVDAMYEDMLNYDYKAVIDATHPFATEVTKNIKEAADRAKLPYIRLRRKSSQINYDKINYFDTIDECIEALKNTTGNIMLTTGSKELKKYIEAGIPIERLYVRIIPGVESIEICNELGISAKHIIAIQGPFTALLNKALIAQYNIEHLVTKESGINGGYEEKISAVYDMGISGYVINNPERNILENTLYIETVIDKLSSMIGVDITSKIKRISKDMIRINLIGCGMGDMDNLTYAARTSLEKSEYLFGAPRLLKSASGLTLRAKDKLPYYLAKDIIPYLDKLSENLAIEETEVSILFSGDITFFSGCTKLKSALDENDYYTVSLYPGISSISYLAMKAGIPWQDAVIKSLHGVDDNILVESISEIMQEFDKGRKVFLLLSDRNQLIKLLEGFDDKDIITCHIGYELSHDNEKIIEGSISEILMNNFFDEGLYSMFIEYMR